MARYVAINPPLRPGQRVRCHICGRWTDKALVDLDGTPFEAFVCIGDCEAKP